MVLDYTLTNPDRACPPGRRAQNVQSSNTVLHETHGRRTLQQRGQHSGPTSNFTPTRCPHLRRTVQLGQKAYSWTVRETGQILTGDMAAAPRYMEARLSKLALDVVFNTKTTDGNCPRRRTGPIRYPSNSSCWPRSRRLAVGLSPKSCHTT